MEAKYLVRFIFNSTLNHKIKFQLNAEINNFCCKEKNLLITNYNFQSNYHY